MNYAGMVLNQIVIFAVYALIGVYAVRTGVLNRDSLGTVSAVVVKVTLPFLLFANTVNGITRAQFIASLPVLCYSAGLYLIYLLCGFLLQKLIRLHGPQGDAFRGCVMFGNVGFIGIPIIASLFPGTGMLYIAMFTVVDQLVLWTYGIRLAGGAVSLRKMINPAVIAIVLALLFVLSGLHLPDTVMKALGNVGAVTTPLALIYLGGLFCFMDIKASLKTREYYVLVVKMIALPVLVSLLGRVLGLSEDLRMTFAILAGLPVMTSYAMLASVSGNQGDYCAGAVFLTTVLSAATLPLVCVLAGLL